MRFQGWLQANRMIHPDDVPRIEAEVDAEIAEAVAFAEAGTWEPVGELTRFTYAESATATADGETSCSKRPPAPERSRRPTAKR